MKKFRRILLLFLLVPFCFSFVSCKNKSNKTDESGGGGSGGSGGGNGNVSAECFSVAYDYNLPEKYEFLLNDYTDVNNEVGTSVELISIIDDNLAPYFLGWYNTDDELVTGSVTSDTPTTINLKAKWSVDNIDKYYYTKGLVFEVEDGNAKIVDYTGSATKIVLPKFYVSSLVDYDVTLIGDSVFENSNVSSLIINSELFSIGNSTFKSSKITDFDFEKIVELGDSAFENTKISEIEFSENLTNVGEYAFNACLSLEKINFAQAEAVISDYAFNDCLKLEKIENANNITKISDYSFSNCVSLSDMSFLEDNTKITRIGANAFENCTGLTSIFIPESVTYISTPFVGCSNVISVMLARTYATITNGSDMLTKHLGDVSSSVKSITFFGTTTTTLLQNYFNGFVNLETFVMCDSISVVQNYTFKECVNLKNITLSAGISLETFSYNAFYNTKFLKERTEPLIFKGSIVYIPENLVSEYVIPNDVTSINNSAFASKNTLEKITIPSSVELIGDKAFENCTNLKEVVFEVNNKITKINDFVFSSCYKLETIDLTKLTALTEIGVEAFERTNIRNMVIPATVTTIGSGAFMYAETDSFEISGTENKFIAVDDVLYEDISDLGDRSELKLVSYPRLKTNQIFVCPSAVSVISSSAFVNASKLEYVYFAHESVEWESKAAFYGTLGICVLREKSSFELKATGVALYSFVSTPDCQYDGTNIIISNDFVPDTENCFLKEPGNGGKFTIILFDYDFENSTVTSVVVLEDAI